MRDVMLPLVASAEYSGASASETLELMDDIADWLGDKAGPLLSASLQDARGYLEYMAGMISAEEKRAQSHRYIEMLQQTGSHMEAIHIMSGLSFVAWVDGDLALREQIEEGVIEEYERIGDRNYLVALLGEAALNKSRLGRPEEALEIVANARRIGSEEDIGDQIRLDLAEAHARARHGEQAAARSSLESARIRAAGTRMMFLNDEIDVVEGEVEMMAETAPGRWSSPTGSRLRPVSSASHGMPTRSDARLSQPAVIDGSSIASPTTSPVDRRRLPPGSTEEFGSRPRLRQRHWLTIRNAKPSRR